MPDNPFLAFDQRIMGDIYTSSEAMDNLHVLCDDFGSRFGGTEGERKAAEFLQMKMRSYGLENVFAEPIEYVGWQRGTASFEIIEPVRMVIPCITLPHSPPAQLEGTIVDLGPGDPADFESRAADIAGNIVLTSSEIYPKGSKRWIHRGEKYNRSLLAGATGFIFVNHYPGYGPATGGIGRDGEAPIPGFSIAKEDGAFIQRLLARKGAVRVRLASDDACMPMVSWNIIGELPGSQEPSDIVMIGCHYDGHDISQGAGDPASGAVAVLEAARVLARHGDVRPRTLKFVLWGVEEIGLIGSRQYVARHGEELSRIRFYLNMDSAGAINRKGIELNEWAGLAPVFEAWSDEMALEFSVSQSVNAHSDHFPFLLAGVPTGGVRNVDGTRDGRGYGHTRYDTLDKISITNLREAAALSARLIYRIGAAEAWPASRRSREEVEAVLDSPEYREEAKFRAQVDAFYGAMNTAS